MKKDDVASAAGAAAAGVASRGRASPASVGPHNLDFVSGSTLHTERLGERIARLARPGDVVALWGELGAGKTVVARGIAIGLGIEASDVTSPTFVILHEHAAGRLPLFHLDLYRLEGSRDLTSTGWEECLDAGGLTVIEWPERAGGELPADRLDVRLEHVADTKRRVVVDATGPRSRATLAALASDAFGA